MMSSIVGCFSQAHSGATRGCGILIDGNAGATLNYVRNNTVIRNTEVGIYDTALTIVLGAVTFGGSTTLVSGNVAIDNGSSSSLGVTLRNYRVAYRGLTAALLNVISSSFTLILGVLPAVANSAYDKLDIRS
jgi:hypothetical protein